MENFRFLKGKKMTHPTTGITLEYLDKSNAVCFVLFNETKEKVILVKQFRPGPKDYTLEIVAGLIDEGEDPKTAAFRELREETGYTEEDVTDYEELGKSLFVSPGYTTENLYFYSGRLKSDSIKPKELSLDEGEEIEVKWISINDVLKETDDMKTVFGITYFKK
ncbi:NUDIX hydrolase [Leptotrichia sp. OH3620_COT-345]|uniref:NUDIX hydrolase n=1 Tax=Leptotrichia sp. OH3620_COT-345 TaxID=2491048 RepID=UPI000F649F49|nr:NUDIX hydrolase [Leptotrichia sp. OH3620_COT-345]RRD39521.1 NUDIX hydrolase [Leptotrichia sp. OH3620_COT-345]